MATVILRELNPVEMGSTYPLIRLLNPDVGEALFRRRLKMMLSLGYRAVAAFDGKRMVGLSGFWLGARFWCGRQFDIDNFIVHPDYRAKGVGRKLLAWLEKKALEEKAELMVLDSYTTNAPSHRFYFNGGFVITGYHFTKIPGKRVPVAQKAIR